MVKDLSYRFSWFVVKSWSLALAEVYRSLVVSIKIRSMAISILAGLVVRLSSSVSHLLVRNLVMVILSIVDKVHIVFLVVDLILKATLIYELDLRVHITVLLLVLRVVGDPGCRLLSVCVGIASCHGYISHAAGCTLQPAIVFGGCKVSV